MCVSVCGLVCGHVNINEGGGKGAWVRVGLSINVTFHLVSKEKINDFLDFWFIFK